MSSSLARVLIVDGELQIRRFLRAGLTAHKFEVIEATNGAEALQSAIAQHPDLTLLELALPDFDGVDLIARLRSRPETAATLIIVLTARAGEADKIAALDAGADDYLTKPFGMGELLARIRAALRHRVRSQGGPPVFRFGDLTVDLVRREVRRGAAGVKLTPREFEVLRVLVLHAGQVVTHDQLLREVWGEMHVEDSQYLRLYVKQLRRKLEVRPEAPRYIVTEPRVGYRLRDVAASTGRVPIL
jgi:two-component system, OmpR family, KDP operon response regulator KdpE